MRFHGESSPADKNDEDLRKVRGKGATGEKSLPVTLPSVSVSAIASRPEVIRVEGLAAAAAAAAIRRSLF